MENIKEMGRLVWAEKFFLEITSNIKNIGEVHLASVY